MNKIKLNELAIEEQPQCPICRGLKVVKNGKVRGVQRYKCKYCDKNFSEDFEHRWHSSSKLLNLICLRSGQSIKEVAAECGATEETIGRWLLEAKAHNVWMLEALADMVDHGITVNGENPEEAFVGSIGIYIMATGDQLEANLSELSQKLVNLLEVRIDAVDHSGSHLS